jgi:hypothetical protein
VKGELVAAAAANAWNARCQDAVDEKDRCRHSFKPFFGNSPERHIISRGPRSEDSEETHYCSQISALDFFGLFLTNRWVTCQKKAPLTLLINSALKTMSMELRCGSNIAINCPLKRSHNHCLTRIFSVIFRFCCSLVLAARVCDDDRVQCDKRTGARLPTRVPPAPHPQSVANSTSEARRP